MVMMSKGKQYKKRYLESPARRSGKFQIGHCPCTETSTVLYRGGPLLLRSLFFVYETRTDCFQIRRRAVGAIRPPTS